MMTGGSPMTKRKPHFRHGARPSSLDRSEMHLGCWGRSTASKIESFENFSWKCPMSTGLFSISYDISYVSCESLHHGSPMGFFHSQPQPALGLPPGAKRGEGTPRWIGRCESPGCGAASPGFIRRSTEKEPWNGMRILLDLSVGNPKKTGESLRIPPFNPQKNPVKSQ